MTEPRPAWKIAGGKSAVWDSIQHLLPECRIYFEPFVGGGAVFYRMWSARRFKKAVINDISKEIVNLYRVIKQDPEGFMQEADTYRVRMSSEDYYWVRDKLSPSTDIERAARMLYLNKTCFNGLWRHNRSGKFNVPCGLNPKKPPTLYDKSNILAVSKALRSVSITCLDFDLIMDRAGDGDLVFCDPPYVDTFSFYNKSGFSDADHHRLAEAAIEASNRGARVVITNSDCERTRSIYQHQRFCFHQYQAPRSINRNGAGRGRVTELAIVTKNR